HCPAVGRLGGRRRAEPRHHDGVCGRRPGSARYSRGASAALAGPARSVGLPAAGARPAPGRLRARLLGVGSVIGAAPEGPPARTVTMLFTDIEGSTVLLRRLGSRWGEALTAHRAIVRGGGVGADHVIVCGCARRRWWDARDDLNRLTRLNRPSDAGGGHGAK